MEFLRDYENADTISINTLALEELLREERSNEISRLNSLSKKVYCLHADILYYRSVKSKVGAACYEVWKILVKKIGGTPNAWRDLGHSLGIKQEDLDYIMNSVKEDPGDMVLKVFRQNETATIDKILDVFIKMQRYDILKAIEEPLLSIVKYFNVDDSGYHSNGNTTGQREIIIPKDVPNDLPPALNKNVIIMDKKQKKPKPPFIRQPDNRNETEQVNKTPILFLTFAADGLPTALNIQEYVDNWTDFSDVEVITLNAKKEEIYQNPEKFIREYFEKADLIVPIITSGYLYEIRSHTTNIPNTSEDLDHKYVNFIYNLIVTHYIHATGCLNKKVRSVLPQNSDVNLFTSITMYPDLLPWTYETHFDEQFKAFLKIQYT